MVVDFIFYTGAGTELGELEGEADVELAGELEGDVELAGELEGDVELEAELEALGELDGV